MSGEKTLGGSVETGGAKAEAEAGGLLNPPLPPNSGDGADKDSDSALLSPPLPPDSGDEVEEGDSDLLSPPLPPNSGDGAGEPAETETDGKAGELTRVLSPLRAGRTRRPRSRPGVLSPLKRVRAQANRVFP